MKAAGRVRELGAALRPGKNLLFRLRLIHAPKARNMPVRCKARQHFAAHTLRRRGVKALASFCLKGTELRIQRIPFVVAHYGIIAVVIRL